MKSLLCLCVCLPLASCSNSMPSTSAKPPATKAEPVEETLHGVAITDRYRWLEGDNSDPADQGKVTPEVAGWTDAQNGYTRSVLDALPGRQALEARLRPLMEVGAVTRPIVRANRYFFSKREGNQNQPVVYWRAGYKGESKVLIDPARLDESGLTTVEWFAPSPDGKLLAYGTYRAGDEITTLHLLDVDSSMTLGLEIPDKTQPPDWLPDGSGFVYQNLKNPKDPYTGQVLFHRMGTDRAKDRLIFRQYTKEENAKLATTWGPFASLSRDGRWLVLGYWIDTKSNDLWLVDFDRFLATGTIDKTVVTVGADGQATGTVIDGTLFLHTTKGAPRGRIVAAGASQPGQAQWRDLVPERADAIIESVSFGKGVIAVTYLKNAANVVEVFDFKGTSLGVVSQPGIGAAAVTAEIDRTEAYLTFTSFNSPTTIFRVDLATPQAAPELWERPDVPVDPAIAEVEQVWYPSKDGTRISMFLVHRKGLSRHGDTPTLLTGYGGFNINETPVFSATLFQWIEAGGLYAAPQPARRRRVRRRLARGRHARQEAERLRRFHCGGRVVDREPLHQLAAAGDRRRLERRVADCRRPHPAAGSGPCGDRRRAAARHAAVSELPDGAVLGTGVRIGGERRALFVPPRLLALSPCHGRDTVSGGSPDRRRA